MMPTTEADLLALVRALIRDSDLTIEETKLLACAGRKPIRERSQQRAVRFWRGLIHSAMLSAA